MNSQFLNFIYIPTDNHWFEMSITSQPISREAICKMICRFTDQQEDSIAFQDELIFPCGPQLKFSLNPRGTGEYCSLNTTVIIAKQYHYAHVHDEYMDEVSSHTHTHTHTHTHSHT